jgi:putative flippase GtrA
MSKEYLSPFISQAFKFALVGVPNTLIGMGAFSLLVYLVHLNYIAANIISTALALLNSYLMNKYWTFKSRKKSVNELFWFVVVFFLAFGVQNVVLIVAKEHFLLKEIVAYICAAVVYTAVGFLGNKFITFSA